MRSERVHIEGDWIEIIIPAFVFFFFFLNLVPLALFMGHE